MVVVVLLLLKVECDEVKQQVQIEAAKLDSNPCFGAQRPELETTFSFLFKAASTMRGGVLAPTQKCNLYRRRRSSPGCWTSLFGQEAAQVASRTFLPFSRGTNSSFLTINLAY